MSQLVPFSMKLLTKRTLPSAMQAKTPPVWTLRGAPCVLEQPLQQVMQSGLQAADPALARSQGLQGEGAQRQKLPLRACMVPGFELQYGPLSARQNAGIVHALGQHRQGEVRPDLQHVDQRRKGLPARSE